MRQTTKTGMQEEKKQLTGAEQILRKGKDPGRTGSLFGRRAAQKLREQRGETLTETLAAMVIVALGGILLVSLVMASSRTINRADTAYDAYLSARNAVESADTDSTTDSYVTVKSVDSVSNPVTITGNGQEAVHVISAGEGNSALYRYIPADGTAGETR